MWYHQDIVIITHVILFIIIYANIQSNIFFGQLKKTNHTKFNQVVLKL